MSVRQLRKAVREALPTLNVAEDPEAEDAGEEGRIVSFRGPVPVARMFDSAIETARKLLGGHAPRYKCVEALLAETSSEWQQMAPDLEERLERRHTASFSQGQSVEHCSPGANADPRDNANPGTIAEPGINADHAPTTNPPSPEATATPRDNAPPGINADHAPTTNPPSPEATADPDGTADAPDPPSGRAVEIILVPRPNPVLLMNALRTVEQIELEVAEIESLLTADPSAPTSTGLPAISTPSARRSTE